MVETNARWAGNSPIAQALGKDFHDLHSAVRRHYAEPETEIYGTMDVVHVKNIIRPLAAVSYRLLRAPVPYGGRNVRIRLLNRVDDSGAMYWTRTFFGNATFPKEITFTSYMLCSGDHRLIELTRYGLGVESDLSVNGEGGLVYDIRRYVVRTPFRGRILKFPTGLSPFGGGRTREIGLGEDIFRVEFEMTHPVFGQTLAYTGNLRIEPSR